MILPDLCGSGQAAPCAGSELFADLEAQLEQAEAADLASEVADRTRREAAALAARRPAGAGRRRAAGDRLPWRRRRSPACCTRSGPDWLLLEEPSRSEVLLNLAGGAERERRRADGRGADRKGVAGARPLRGRYGDWLAAGSPYRW